MNKKLLVPPVIFPGSNHSSRAGGQYWENKRLKVNVEILSLSRFVTMTCYTMLLKLIKFEKHGLLTGDWI